MTKMTMAAMPLTPVELISRVLDTLAHKHRAPVLYQEVMSIAREVCSRESFDSTEEQHFAVNKTLGGARQAAAYTIKRHIICCGYSPEVRTRADRRTGFHKLLVRCNCCGCVIEIEERGGGEGIEES